MEQKTEASQAVERRAEYDAFCEWVRETPGKPFSDMAWEAWKDGRARLRAALKAQPAPTEAQSEATVDQLIELAESIQIELARQSIAATRAAAYLMNEGEFRTGMEAACDEIATRLQLSGNSGELQPSGNTGEAAQGEYSFSKPKGWINLANPGQSWEQWTKAQGIPTTRGWKISAQGEDSARLDAERYRWLLGNYAFGDGYNHIDAALNDGEADKYLSAAIDRARASAETGGVKP